MIVTERKLCSVQKVHKIEQICGADNVELGYVLGWVTIIRKGQFKEGDYCIFFEIDSVLPDIPVFEFMRQRKFRVKTMRSNRLGVVSQGLAMCLQELLSENEISDIMRDYGENVEGLDLSEKLNIQKYELPLEAGKNSKPKGLFPTHLVPKTDEMRIQSFPQLIEEIRGMPYIITVKVDGTSCTIFSWRDEFGVCSRNLELYDGVGDIYWKIIHKYELDIKLPEYCKLTERNLALQGEIAGKKIANNPMNLTNDDIFIFSVFDMDNRKYMDYDSAKSIATDLGLKFVPLEERGECFNYTMYDLEEKAKGNYPCTNNEREGIVVRPAKYTYSPFLGNQLSFKVISVKYLLNEK